MGDDFILAGERHLALAFFSIVITAPIGAILTVWSGEILLSQGEAPKEQLPETEWGRKAYGHGKGLESEKLHAIAETLKHQKSNAESGDIYRGVSQFESHDVAKAIQDYDREHHHLEHEQENESDSDDSEEAALHRDWSLQNDKINHSWSLEKDESDHHGEKFGSLHRSMTSAGPKANPNNDKRGSAIPQKSPDENRD